MRLRPACLAAFLFVSSIAPHLRAAPALRQVRDLTVHSPAHTEPPPPGLRLRTHVRPSDRVWIGREVPSFVPLESGHAVLDLLDLEGGTYVALYRERFDHCGAGTNKGKNCAAEVRLYDTAGKELAVVPLGPHLSRPDNLEVQDIHFDQGTLYFNEACQTFSSEAGGRCSSLVALDPFAKRVKWRTPPLVSNNWFVLAGDYIVAAYGFTHEPAAIRIVRKKDGAIMQRKDLESTNFEMTVKGNVLGVDLWHRIGRVHFEMIGFDGDAPKLVRTTGP